MHVRRGGAARFGVQVQVSSDANAHPVVRSSFLQQRFRGGCFRRDPRIQVACPLVQELAVALRQHGSACVCAACLRRGWIAQGSCERERLCVRSTSGSKFALPAQVTLGDLESDVEKLGAASRGHDDCPGPGVQQPRLLEFAFKVEEVDDFVLIAFRSFAAGIRRSLEPQNLLSRGGSSLPLPLQRTRLRGLVAEGALLRVVLGFDGSQMVDL